MHNMHRFDKILQQLYTQDPLGLYYVIVISAYTYVDVYTNILSTEEVEVTIILCDSMCIIYMNMNHQYEVYL